MKSKSSSICSWFDDLSEYEHLIVLAPVSAFLVGHGGTMMIPVPELHDMESAAVDIEMDVALLEVGSDGFPDADLGMQCLDGTPRCLSDATAMDFGRNEEQLELSLRFVLVDAQYHAAHEPAIENDAVGFGTFAIDAPLDGGARNDFRTFFGTVIAHSKLNLGPISECPLKVEDELLAVILVQRYK